MNKERLKKAVIEENIRHHAKEAPVYEALHPQMFHWYHQRKSWRDMNYIRGLLDADREMDVLDLGCGTGFLTMKALRWANARVTSVDLSREMLAQLEKKDWALGKDRLTTVNREALAFLRESALRYDLIMASALLHHLVDFNEFVELALENLKPRGVLYIAYEPLKQPIDSKVRFMFHRLMRGLDNFMFKRRLNAMGMELDEDHEKSLADYQSTLGGIAPGEITGMLEGRGELLRLDKFPVRAVGALAFISDKIIGSQNTFSLIFRKS